MRIIFLSLKCILSIDKRQVEKHDHILVSGNGGVLNYHSTTILSKHPA